jgi:hypothetical protein
MSGPGGGGPPPPTDTELQAAESDQNIKIRQNDELQNLFDQASNFFFGSGSQGAQAATPDIPATYDTNGTELTPFIPGKPAVQGRGRFGSNLPDLQPGLNLQGRAVGDFTNAAQGFRDSSGAFRNTAGSFNTAAGNADDVTSRAAEALKFLTSGDVLRPDSNPYLQQFIDLSNNSIQSQFTEGVIPSLQSGAAATGNIGSSRQGIAEGIASGKFADAITRNTADLSNRGYQTGLNAYVNGISLSPTIANAQGIGAGFRGVGAEFLKDSATTNLNAGNAQLAAGNTQIGIDSAGYNQELEALRQYNDIIAGRSFGSTAPAFTPPAQARGNKFATAAGAGVAAGAATGNPYVGAGVALISLV